MANTFYVAPTASFVQKTLNGAITNNASSITLNNTTNMQAPGFIVIDRTDSTGTATPNAREIVSYTNVSGSQITGCTRAADGGTALPHGDGAIVETTPTAAMWNSLTTIVATAMTSDGYINAINSPVSISRMEIIQTAIVSTASIAQLQSLRAFLSNITVSNSMNASGASIIGLFPSGASGSVLTNNGNALPPVFAPAPTAPTYPSFSVNKNGSTQTGGFGASASFVKATWSTEEFDTNNNFASNAFTPTVAGYYFLTASIITNSSVADQVNMYVAIYKNGSVYKLNTIRNSGTAGNTVPISVIANANGSSDYFEVFTSTDNGSAYDIDGTATKTFFSGSRIS